MILLIGSKKEILLIGPLKIYTEFLVSKQKIQGISTQIIS